MVFSIQNNPRGFSTVPANQNECDQIVARPRPITHDISGGSELVNNLRVMLVDDDSITRLDLRELLEKKDIIVVGECGDGKTAIQMAKSFQPDLILMDVKMPVMDGIEAAKRLAAEGIGPVMLLTAHNEIDLVEQAREAGVLAYLVKPIREQDLVPACQIAVARYKEFNVLREENKDLRQALEARKVIERAKGILQRQYQFTEEEAFRRLRTMAMNRQKPIREIAEAIILADEMAR